MQKFLALVVLLYGNTVFGLPPEQPLPTARRAYCGVINNFYYQRSRKKGDSITVLFSGSGSAYWIEGYYPVPMGIPMPIFELFGRHNNQIDRAFFLNAIRRIGESKEAGKHLCFAYPADADRALVSSTQLESGETDSEALAKINERL